MFAFHLCPRIIHFLLILTAECSYKLQVYFLFSLTDLNLFNNISHLMLTIYFQILSNTQYVLSCRSQHCSRFTIIIQQTFLNISAYHNEEANNASSINAKMVISKHDYMENILDEMKIMKMTTNNI